MGMGQSQQIAAKVSTSGELPDRSLRRAMVVEEDREEKINIAYNGAK